MLCKEGPKGLIKEPSEVDKFIKVKVVGDAINLMNDKSLKADRTKVEKYGCWRRILPSLDDEEYQTFSKAKYLFEKLLNRNGCKTMSLTAFGKLSKIKALKQRVTRVQLDLLYKRIL